MRQREQVANHLVPLPRVMTECETLRQARMLVMLVMLWRAVIIITATLVIIRVVVYSSSLIIISLQVTSSLIIIHTRLDVHHVRRHHMTHTPHSPNTSTFLFKKFCRVTHPYDTFCHFRIFGSFSCSWRWLEPPAPSRDGGGTRGGGQIQ